MTEKRKQEIINDLMIIYDEFEPSDELSELFMFTLISRYNSTGKNDELIGGDWVIKNCPEQLKILP